MAEVIDEMRAPFDYDDAVYYQQIIKLPFKVNKAPCDTFGQGVFIQLYEHEVDAYKKANQFIYMLNVNLLALDKPRAVNKFTHFWQAATPVKEKEEDDPFASSGTEACSVGGGGGTAAGGSGGAAAADAAMSGG